LRTKNIEYNLLVLEVLLEEYVKSGNIELRRFRLLELCKSAYNQTYGDKSELGHSTFNRCVRDLQEEMAIRIKKIGKKHTTIIINPERIRKMVNEMNSKLGFYRQEARLTIEDIESETLEPFFKQLSDAMLKNYSNPWLSNINEKSRDANLIAQKCASKIFAKLISSRFGFTLSTNDNSFKSIDKNHLYELGMVASKIASIRLNEPFQLLIDYSGLPESDDWGIITTGDLWSILILDFKVFAKRVFKFDLSMDDLNSLIDKRSSSMSKPAVRLFDIFRDGYLLPTLRAMKSRQIKFDNNL
jgi:plasmid maintenance system killer protein